MRARRTWTTAFVVLALASGVCSAQVDPWGSLTFADPLRFSSLPISGNEVVVPAPGQWQLSTTLSYFNVWQRTWHTGTIHQEFGLLGKPLQDWELRTLEFRHAGDQFYHMDFEGWRNDLVVTRGFAGGIAVTFLVPWVGIGSPHWDAIPQDFHSTLGLSPVWRERFPRGQNVVYVRGRKGYVEYLSGLEGSGIGDARFSVTGRLGRWLGAEQRWVVAVEAPTGDAGTLRGSGGWDAGLRWFGTWGRGASQVRIGLGYAWLDPAGSWLGVRRDNIWGVLVEGHTPLAGRVLLRGSARFDSSPLASFTDSDMGRPSFYWTVGALAPVAGSSWVAFDLGENYLSNAEVPDFSFHLQFGIRLPGAR